MIYKGSIQYETEVSINPKIKNNNIPATLLFFKTGVIK